jgi:uncharacterized membrane protein YqjE
VSVAGSTPPGRRGADQPHNIAAAIAEVSERATALVREEIELAKAEVSEKATKLVKGAIVGVAAGIFFMTALVFALTGCAWLLYYVLPGGDFTYFWGFFAMAAILVALGVIAGLVAARAVKRSSPPVPKMAIEEARKIRETVSAPAASAGPAAAAPDAPPAPVDGSFAQAPGAPSPAAETAVAALVVDAPEQEQSEGEEAGVQEAETAASEAAASEAAVSEAALGDEQPEADATKLSEVPEVPAQADASAMAEATGAGEESAFPESSAPQGADGDDEEVER